MSALNCFVGADAVNLFTDGGLYDMSDVSRKGGATNKVALLPRYNAVIGATGMHNIPLLVEGFLIDRGFQSFDELARDFGTFMREIIQKYADALSMSPAVAEKIPKDWGQFECILAGWSESKDKPTAVLVREFRHEGVPAFTATEITEHYAPFAPGMQYHIWNPHDIAGSGLKLLQAQHAMKFPVRVGPNSKREVVEGTFSLAEPKTFCVVSEFAQHTRVDRDGFTVRVLERWPNLIDGTKHAHPTLVPEPANA